MMTTTFFLLILSIFNAPWTIAEDSIVAPSPPIPNCRWASHVTENSIVAQDIFKTLEGCSLYIRSQLLDYPPAFLGKLTFVPKGQPPIECNTVLYVAVYRGLNVQQKVAVEAKITLDSETASARDLRVASDILKALDRDFKSALTAINEVYRLKCDKEKAPDNPPSTLLHPRHRK